MRAKEAIMWVFFGFVCPLLLLLLFQLIAWSMESRTYNRLTGASTTWWDAVWVELRVQDQPIKQPQNQEKR
jgi:ABC-type spermidine/putrescine transport system permease subunit II